MMMKNGYIKIMIVLLVVTLWACKTTKNGSLNIADEGVNDTLVFVKVDSTKVNLEEIIGYSDYGLTLARPEGALNNYIADLFLEIGNNLLKGEDRNTADFCVFNYAGIKNSIPVGAIKVKDVYKVIPYDSELVLLRVSGACIDSVFNHIASRGGEPIANVSLQIVKDGYKNATIGKRPYDSRKMYRIITSDFLANGGDGMVFFKPYATYKLGFNIRDALMLKISNSHNNGIKVDAKLDQRITRIQD